MTNKSPEKIPILFHIKNYDIKLFNSELSKKHISKKFISLYYEEYKNINLKNKRIFNLIKKYCVKYSFNTSDREQLKIYKSNPDTYYIYLYYLLRYEKTKEKLVSLIRSIIHEELDKQTYKQMIKKPNVILAGISRNQYSTEILDDIMKLYEKFASMLLINLNTHKAEYLETIIKYGARTGSLEFVILFLKKYKQTISPRFQEIANIHNIAVKNSIIKSHRNIYDYILTIDSKNISKLDVVLWLGKSSNITFIEEMTLEFFRNNFDLYEMIRESLYGKADEITFRYFLNKLNDDNIDSLLGSLNIDSSYSLEFYEKYISCFHKFVSNNNKMFSILVKIRSNIDKSQSKTTK